MITGWRGGGLRPFKWTPLSLSGYHSENYFIENKIKVSKLNQLNQVQKLTLHIYNKFLHHFLDNWTLTTCIHLPKGRDTKTITIYDYRYQFFSYVQLILYTNMQIYNSLQFQPLSRYIFSILLETFPNFERIFWQNLAIRHRQTNYLRII